MTPFQANVRAILLMTLSQILFVLNDTLAKLASASLPVGEIIFIRSIFAGAFVWAIIAASGQYGGLRALRGRPLWLRSAAEIGATIFYLLALAHMPLAAVVTVFQATPFVITAAAAIFLAEAVGWRRWTAIAVGFLGVLIVVRPGLQSADLSILFIVGSICSVTVRDLATRHLPVTTPTLLVIGIAAIVLATSGAALGVVETWVLPSPVTIIELAAAAVIVVGGYQALIGSLRIGDLSVAAPFRYTVVVWGTILGFLVWGDVPDPFTVVGTAVIIASGIYMFQRERRLARIPSFDEP